MKIFKNNTLVPDAKRVPGKRNPQEKYNRILSATSRIGKIGKQLKEMGLSLLDAFEKESEIFKNVYLVDRYSNFYVHNDPFSTLPKRNLFSPLRLLLESTDMSKVFIEGNNPMQHAIKNNNKEAFLALYNSDNAEILINGYNEANNVNTLGSCLSLYLKDVWEGNPASLSFTFFNAVVNHPSWIFKEYTGLEKWSDSIHISKDFSTDTNTLDLEWACLMEVYGNKTVKSFEILSEASEPGSIFFIQTILDRFVKNDKKNNDIFFIDLIIRTLTFSVENSLPRSVSTILDFPNIENNQFLEGGILGTQNSLLQTSILNHGKKSDLKPGYFIDSYQIFEKLCFFPNNQADQNLDGLSVLMLIAMRGWITFAKLVDRIYLIGYDTKQRLDYLNLQDNLGRTALDYAVLYPEMQEYLKSIGCVSKTPITVSPKNATVLGGIDKYKKSEDYNSFPFLWLETFYGDTEAVRSTPFNFDSIAKYENLSGSFDPSSELGYFGIPLKYELGGEVLQSYPQDIAIKYGNIEMYSIWNQKLYNEKGTLYPKLGVSDVPIEVIPNNNDQPFMINYRTDEAQVFLNTNERNIVTIFGNEKILDSYLDFLYRQVDKNRYTNFLIMNQYVLNETNKKIMNTWCTKYINDNNTIDNIEYKYNWVYNICANQTFNLFKINQIPRFPSSEQTLYCGCCYAVATMAMIDINLSVQLFENELPIYKQGERLGAQSYQMPLSCMPTGDCLGSGGSVKQTLLWHQNNYSVPLDCIPYTSWKYVKDQKEAMKPIENGGKLVDLCPSKNPNDCSKKAIKITSDPKNTYRATDMSAMIRALNQGYALVTVMRLPSDFINFDGKGVVYFRARSGWLADSDVYSSVTNPYVAKSSFHVVVIIGYGETQGAKYWIILNSWGDVYQSPFDDEKDEKGNPKMVPYFTIIRGTDDVWMESSGAYYTIPLLRNEDGTTSPITSETWPLKSKK